MDIPKPIQNLLTQMVKAAAPEIAGQIDNLMAVAQSFKAQLDRVEANQQIIKRSLGVNQGEIDDGRSTGTTGSSAGEERRLGSNASKPQ